MTLLGLFLVDCAAPETGKDPAVAEGAGQTVVGTDDDGGETLHLIPPTGWTLTSSSTTGDFRRAHYLRDAGAEFPETLTAEAFPAADQPDPLSFLDALAADEKDRCTDFSRHPVFAGEENGFATVVEVHRCPQRRINNRAAVRLLKVIQGQERYVVLTLGKEGPAKRADDGWSTAFTTEEDMATWALYLKEAYLAPAPSND